MLHHLTIDQGNTVTKVSVWEADNYSHPIDYRCYRQFGPAEARNLLETYNVDTIVHSNVSVRDADVSTTLTSGCRHLLEVTATTPLPLEISYSTPETLGPDRIAAAVGAFDLAGPGKELLVVDIGTAVTYDHVTSKGVYLGGNIAPGVKLRLRALHSYTARLPEVEIPEQTATVPIFGDSTGCAMVLGALHGVAAEVEHYQRLISSLNPDCAVVVTGGRAPVVLPLLGISVIHAPRLVDNGLLRILLHNQALEQ